MNIFDDPLDSQIPVSFFGGLRKLRPQVENLTLRELANRIPAQKRETKDDLPMLKLAVMDGGASKEHVKSFTGAMVDYDAGSISLDEAHARLKRIGIASVIYSSPSSSAASPRWRVLAPYSRQIGAEEHQSMTDRLNGALGGIIDDAASWEIHQRFYYGQARVRDAKKGGGIADPVEVRTVGGDFLDIIRIAPAERPARVKAVRPTIEEDEDDLFAIVRKTPMGLSQEEIDDILAAIPNDGEGLHYDDYLQVGMALHHEFQGSDEGFEVWCEWAEQSDKFNRRNAADRWKSFHTSTSQPVRMASLIQVAKLNRATDLVRFEVENDNPVDLSDLLGDPVPAKAAPKDDPDWAKKLHMGKKELKSSLTNVALIIENDKRTRGIVHFNQFTHSAVLRKKPVRVRKKSSEDLETLNLTGELWDVTDPLNGDAWSDSHDTAVRAIIEAKESLGGYAISISDRDLRGAVDMAAQKNTFHPVKEVITATPWDGTPRAETMFIDYLGCEDNPYNRQAALLTLVGAVARIFQPGHKFDFVPILEGAQGKGKSTFIRILGLQWYAELQGDIGDNNRMIEAMQGAWVLELGELSAMSRSDVNDLKAFVTRQADKGRLAYAKRVGVYPRQCIFIGSTNDREYLRDQTGNRRFWPVVCQLVGEIDLDAFSQNVMQIWAEAVEIYNKMVIDYAGRPELPLFMKDEAAAIAVEMQESRRVESSEEMLAGEIVAWLDTPLGAEFDDLDADAPKLYRQETCIVQIWHEMMARDGSIPHTETIKLGKAMQIVGWHRSKGPVNTSDLNRKYGKCRIYTRPEDLL